MGSAFLQGPCKWESLKSIAIISLLHAYIQLYHIQKLVCGVKGGLPHSGLKAALSPPQQWSAHEMNVTISTNNFISIASDDFAGNCIEPMYGTPARYKVFYRILPGYRSITLPARDISSANELQDVVAGVFADFQWSRLMNLVIITLILNTS